jgi:transposase
VALIVKQVRIVKKAMGWFAIVSISSDIEIPQPLPHGHFIGVDVGLLNYLATSDGFVEPGRKFFTVEYRRLKVLQHRLSKKVKRSKNKDRIHSCPECRYEIDRDIASAQELCNRGIETYPGTLEKQEIGSQVGLSGAMSLDKWRRGAMPNSDIGKPSLYSKS